MAYPVKCLMNNFLLIAVFISFHGYSLESANIQPICNSTTASTDVLIDTRLGQALNDLQDRFQTVESRLAQPEKFVEALDEVIRESDYANILECRDRILKDPRFDFEIKFMDPDDNSSMRVDSKYSRVSTNEVHTRAHLVFDIKNDVQGVLFVYLHELTHLCQGHRLSQLWLDHKNTQDGLTNKQIRALYKLSDVDWKSFDAKTQELMSIADKAMGAYNRYVAFMEIEAFTNMALAYDYFLKYSPRLCRTEPDGDELFSSYQRLFDGLNSGAAPVMFVNGTAHYQDDHFYNVDRYLFDPNAGPKEYLLPSGRLMKANPVHPDLKKMIKDFGIPVKD